MDKGNEIDPIRRGLGMRLKAARLAKDMTQTHVANRFGLTKETVSAWETGRGDPGIYRLRELAKLYDVSADALLWENSLSNEAMQLAAEFDALSQEQRRTLRAVWMAYVTQSAPGGEDLPNAPDLPNQGDEAPDANQPKVRQDVRDFKDLLISRPMGKPPERRKA